MTRAPFDPVDQSKPSNSIGRLVSVRIRESRPGGNWKQLPELAPLVTPEKVRRAIPDEDVLDDGLDQLSRTRRAQSAQRTQRIIALLFGILIGGLLSAFGFAFLN